MRKRSAGAWLGERGEKGVAWRRWGLAVIFGLGLWGCDEAFLPAGQGASFEDVLTGDGAAQEEAAAGEGDDLGILTEALVANVVCTSSVAGPYCCGDMTTGSGCTVGTTLLQCPGKNMAPTSAKACPSGCKTMPSGQNDYCAIGATEITALITAAKAAIGTKGGQCKPWVKNIVAATYPGVSIPTTASTQYEWTSSVHSSAKASWRSTYAVSRSDQKTVAGSSKYTTTVTVPNSDLYQVILYGTSVTATLTKSTGATVASVTGTAGGVLSGTFSGSGTYTLTVTNTSTSSKTFTAVVLSRSRFSSDFGTALRGDVMQMYGDFTTNQTQINPHTAIVLTDGNTGTNWIDSNWCTGNCEVVSQHTVSLDAMMKYMNRLSTFGFTVYRIQ
jgi:hypothetical protein